MPRLNSAFSGHHALTPLLAAALCLNALACSSDKDDPARDDTGIAEVEAGVSDAGLDSAAVGDGGAADRSVGDGTADGVQSDTQRPPARWRTVATMSSPRWRHTLTALADGTLLAVGGYTNDIVGSATASAERYNPTSDQWSAAGQLSSTRAEHSAHRLTDGRVVILGGCVDTPSIGCMSGLKPEVYDPSNTSTPWQVGAAPPRNRRSHASVQLDDGRVAMFGGFDNLNDHTAIDIYDPGNDQWNTPVATLGGARNRATATLLPSGKVLIAGGARPDSGGLTYLGTLEVYDPSNGQVLSLTPALSEGRMGHTATLLDDGRVLFTGGYCGPSCSITKAEIYNPLLGTVTDAGSPGSSVHAHAAIALNNQRVLVTGGDRTQSLTRVFTLTPLGWLSTAAMQDERAWHAAAKLGDEIVVTGGKSATKALDTVEIYTP